MAEVAEAPVPETLRFLTRDSAFAVREKFRLTLDLLVPNEATWTAFARDTLERSSIQSLSKYVTLLVCESFTKRLLASARYCSSQ